MSVRAATRARWADEIERVLGDVETGGHNCPTGFHRPCRNCYAKHGCRCARCTEAERQYRAAYRSRKGS